MTRNELKGQLLDQDPPTDRQAAIREALDRIQRYEITSPSVDRLIDVCREIVALFDGLRALPPEGVIPQKKDEEVDSRQSSSEKAASVGISASAGETAPRIKQTRVWMVESGYYDQRGVYGLYVSLDAAIKGTKARYGAPYRVQWQEERHEDESAELTGYFDAVIGYSTQHVGVYDISPQPLMGEATPDPARVQSDEPAQAIGSATDPSSSSAPRLPQERKD